jgi:hypothetical protein
MTTTIRKLEGLVRLRAVGTSEGSRKGWENRGDRTGGGESKYKGKFTHTKSIDFGIPMLMSTRLRRGGRFSSITMKKARIKR